MWNIGSVTLTGSFMNINCMFLFAMLVFMWKVLSGTMKCQWLVLMSRCGKELCLTPSHVS